MRHRVLAWCAVVAVSFGMPSAALAWEADVHFGLTKWLAQQAGFTAPQADAIATGNHRMDFGSMETMNIVADYACGNTDVDTARVAQRTHHPSETVVPAPVVQRAVKAGSDATTEALQRVLEEAPQRASSLLHKFGEALHPLQDAWARESTAYEDDRTRETPGTGLQALPCDPQLMPVRAGHASDDLAHRGDITAARPDAALATARASFEWLQRYPPIAGGQRIAEPWHRVEAQLGSFFVASTKAAKAGWFRAHGIDDVSFLEGISLPDGPIPWTENWPGRRLPRLPAATSTQHRVPGDVLKFFDAFFAQWLSGADPAGGLKASDDSASQRELAARLRLWRTRDHGAAAALAHAPSPLTRAQLRRVDDLVRGGKAYAHYPRLADAFLPLMGIEAYPSPLLPYVVRPLPASPSGEPRMMAIAKLRHAPYDELVLIARQQRGRWSMVSLLSMVDH